MTDSDSSNFEEEGRGHLLRGEAEKALAVFKKGLAKFPGDRDLFLGSAMAHIDLGNYILAIEIAEALIKENPTWGDALQALAEACLCQGKNARALECVEQATGPHEKDAAFIYTLGVLLFRHGHFQQAHECHRRALARDLMFAPAYLGLGVCRHKLGDVPAAIDAIHRAVEASPDYCEAWNYLGHLLFDTKKKSEARLAWGKIPVEKLMDANTVKRLIPLIPGPENVEIRKALRARLKQLEAVAPETDRKGVAGAMEALGERMDQASRAKAPEGGIILWRGIPTILDGPTCELGFKLGGILGKMFAEPKDSSDPHPRMNRFDRVRAERFLLLLGDYLDQYPWVPPYNAEETLRGLRENYAEGQFETRPDSALAKKGEVEVQRLADLKFCELADVHGLLVYAKAVVLETRKRVDKKIQPAVAYVTLRESLERVKGHLPTKSPYWQAWIELRAALEPQ